MICYIGIYTQKKRLINGKISSYEGLHEKNLSALVTTCRQLSKLQFSTTADSCHFYTPKTSCFRGIEMKHWFNQITNNISM